MPQNHFTAQEQQELLSLDDTADGNQTNLEEVLAVLQSYPADAVLENLVKTDWAQRDGSSDSGSSSSSSSSSSQKAASVSIIAGIQDSGPLLEDQEDEHLDEEEQMLAEAEYELETKGPRVNPMLGPQPDSQDMRSQSEGSYQNTMAMMQSQSAARYLPPPPGAIGALPPPPGAIAPLPPPPGAIAYASQHTPPYIGGTPYSQQVPQYAQQYAPPNTFSVPPQAPRVIPQFHRPMPATMLKAGASTYPLADGGPTNPSPNNSDITPGAITPVVHDLT